MSHPSVHFLKGFFKAAAEAGLSPKEAYEGAKRLEINNFAPVVSKRRGLSPVEQQEIREGTQKVLPKIFKSMGDPISADMSSPNWGGGIGATVGAIPGGFIGHALGSQLAGTNQTSMAPAIGALIGVLGGGTLGGLVGYHGTDARNNSLIEAMRKLPEGATRDDFERDPRIQAQLSRDAMLQAAQLHSMHNF